MPDPCPYCGRELPDNERAAYGGKCENCSVNGWRYIDAQPMAPQSKRTLALLDSAKLLTPNQRRERRG